jgi:putative membrane protein
MWCDWNTMGFFGWTMMVVFWGAVVALTVWAVRSTRTHSSESRSGALDILERRFAAGEIDRDEFEARRALLVEDLETRR